MMMTRPEPDPPPAKLFGRRTVKLQIGAVSLAVLVAGAWLAPPAPATRVVTAEERPAPLLEERTVVRDAAALARTIDGVVQAAADRSVRFDVPAGSARRQLTDVTGSPPAPSSAFGVRVSDTHVLTHVDALPPALSVPAFDAAGAPFTASVAAFDAVSGLVLLAAPSSGAGTVALSDDVRAGALVVGVGRSAAGILASPVYVNQTAAGPDGGVVLGAEVRPGLPIYDLEGRLIAVAGGRPARRAIAAAPALARMAAAGAASVAPTAFGVALQDRAGPLADLFGPAGAIVGDVIPGGPADRAGLAAGDLVLDVAGTAVTDAASGLRALETAAGGGPAVPLTVRAFGARRPRTIELTAEPAVVVAALARRRGGTIAAPPAAAVFDRPALDAAGIAADARVLSIGGVPTSSRDDAIRALRRTRGPAAVVLADDRGRWVAAVGAPQ